MKAIILLSVILLTFSACGSSQQPSADSAAYGMTENIHVSTDGSMVEIVIPRDYMEAATQDELDKAAADMGIQSITLNEDGSATYLMTPKQHEAMVHDIAERIRKSLEDMLSSDDYKHFTAIDTNEDFTRFTVTTTENRLDFIESFSVMSFYMYGNMYNAFNGTPAGNIHVEFINAVSGEIISSSDSSQMDLN